MRLACAGGRNLQPAACLEREVGVGERRGQPVGRRVDHRGTQPGELRRYRRPLATWARILIGAAAEAAFLAYVIVAGRRAQAAGLTADMAEAPDVAPVAG